MCERVGKQEVASEVATQRSTNVVLKVLKEDERKVVETLIQEAGTMLQKDIRWKVCQE